MVNEHNKSPISLREGKVFLDGVEVMNAVAFTANAVPDVWTGQQLGERTKSSRYLGLTITGSITRRRSTPWLKEKIKEFLRNGRTPEFTVQGYMNDENSDYYAKYGADLVTYVGCVLTGDIPLTRLDSGGEVVDDVLNFSAKDVV